MLNQSQEYTHFSSTINNYISAKMTDKGISYDEYNYSYIWDLVKLQGVVFREFCFEGVASERISGMLVCDYLETTIGVNQKLDEKSKIFTISHEIIHYLFHVNSENAIFTDTPKNFCYSSQEILQEFQANIGAAAVLIPEVIFIHYLKKGWSIQQLSDHFSMPESILYKRLIQTMQVNFDVSFLTAKKYADDICYRFEQKGRKISTEIGTELAVDVMI